jgi:hypothetical protein
MFSTRLIHVIECKGDEILDRVADQLRREPLMTQRKFIQDFELQGLCSDVLHHLGDLLSSGNTHDMAHRFERFGALCFYQAIPLQEAMRALSMLREKMLDVAQENMLSNSSIELYAEEELDRRLGRFFDHLAIRLARGFEDAVRHPSAADSRIGPTIH